MKPQTLTKKAMRKLAKSSQAAKPSQATKLTAKPKAIAKPSQDKPKAVANQKAIAKPSQNTKPKATAKPSQPAKPKAIAKPKPVQPKVKPVSKAQSLQDTLKAAQAKIAKLEAENAELKARLDKLSRKPLKIAGWLVVQRKAGGGECKYWYAGKSIGGKMKWIYLGKVLKVKEARMKIEEKAKKLLDHNPKKKG